MKLQNLTVIFIAIIIPVILLLSIYITTGQKTIKYQTQYDTGLVTAAHDAVYAYEINSTSSEFSDSPEKKRELLKASINAFEKSLCNSCGISSYSQSEIEEYIPAIVFGMYDGFYMYAPSELEQNGKTTYKHNLKNYVYYSETLDDGTVIRYSLDTYIVVISKDGIRAGYLIDEDKYKSLSITDEYAKTYYADATDFTGWVKKQNNFPAYLKPGNNNDPEDENSAFVQHKREIMKNKIENVLNSSITAYSQRLGSKTYKMPKLSEEDWQKIYNNISMVAFFQGKSIGLKDYNGYCVLNSTNSKEYANPNLLYFIYGGEYHDIRCNNLKMATELFSGYKISRFSKTLEESTTINDDGTTKTENKYVYENDEPSCYSCINGQKTITIWDYIKIKGGTADGNIKNSYWNSLFRERYLTAKLLTGSKLRKFTVKYYINNNQIEDTEEYEEGTIVTVRDNLSINTEKEYFNGWLKNDGTLREGGTTFTITENVTFTAQLKSKRKIHYEPGANDVTGTMEDTVVDADGGIIATCAYNRPKYSFKNWNTKADGTGDDEYDPGDKYAGDNDLTLYAQWSPNKESTQTVTINYKDLVYNYDNEKTQVVTLATSTAEVKKEGNRTYILLPENKMNFNVQENNNVNSCEFNTSDGVISCNVEYSENVYIDQNVYTNQAEICSWSYGNEKRYVLGENIKNEIDIGEEVTEIDLYAVYYQIKYVHYDDENIENFACEDVKFNIEDNNFSYYVDYIRETDANDGNMDGYKWVQEDKNGDKIKHLPGDTMEGINNKDCARNLNHTIILTKEQVKATIKYYVGRNFNECMKIQEQEVLPGIDGEIWKYVKLKNDRSWPPNITNGEYYWKDKNGVKYEFNEKISINNNTHYNIADGETLHLLLYGKIDEKTDSPYYDSGSSYNETVNFSTTLNANMIMSAMNKSVKAILNESREKIKQNSK